MTHECRVKGDIQECMGSYVRCYVRPSDLHGSGIELLLNRACMVSALRASV